MKQQPSLLTKKQLNNLIQQQKDKKHNQ